MPNRSDRTELVTPATELLAANALDALRGPMSRGAVPTAALAELVGRPRSTVSRLINRETGRSGSTGFDLVVRSCFDTDRNGTHLRWQEALAFYVSSQGPPGLSAEGEFSEQVLKKMLSDGFNGTGGGDARTPILVGYLLHCAALLYRAEHSGEEPDCVAGAILGLRSETYEQSTAIYASAMRFVLSASRRRPRGNYSVEDIVVMLHSLFDGFYIRHVLDPDRYPLETLVDVIWDLTVTMTEPGFLAADGKDSPLRNHLVELTLDLVRKKSEVPELALLAAESDLDVSAVSSEFADQEQLAGACLEKLCCHAIELRSLAGQTASLARWTLKGFLSWMASIVDDYGPLVRTAPEAKVWFELASSIEMMLLSSSDKLEPIKRREIAKKLLDAVRNGSTWEPALTMLLDVLEPEI